MSNLTLVRDNTHLGDSAELPYVPPEKDVKYKPKNLYLAGPMRGYPRFNVDVFDSAARELRRRGFIVLNPCDKDRADHGDSVFDSPTGDLADIAHLGFDLNHALAWDLEYIAKQADAIALLPGWQKSSGARAERACAEALGKEILLVDEGGVELKEYTRIDRHGIGAVGPTFALRPPWLPDGNEEVRVTSVTGGAKGVKPERFDLLPPQALALIARHFAAGASKYSDHNWRKGYAWSLSYAALQRHLNAFWGGEDVDEETGSHHLAAAGFHVLALLTYTHDEQYATFDDRYVSDKGKVNRIPGKA